jgi:hypothetical protein
VAALLVLKEVHLVLVVQVVAVMEQIEQVLLQQLQDLQTLVVAVLEEAIFHKQVLQAVLVLLCLAMLDHKKLTVEQ